MLGQLSAPPIFIFGIHTHPQTCQILSDNFDYFFNEQSGQAFCLEFSRDKSLTDAIEKHKIAISATTLAVTKATTASTKMLAQLTRDFAVSMHKILQRVHDHKQPSISYCGIDVCAEESAFGFTTPKLRATPRETQGRDRIMAKNIARAIKKYNGKTVTWLAGGHQGVLNFLNEEIPGIDNQACCIYLYQGEILEHSSPLYNEHTSYKHQRILQNPKIISINCTGKTDAEISKLIKNEVDKRLAAFKSTKEAKSGDSRQLTGETLIAETKDSRSPAEKYKAAMDHLTVIRNENAIGNWDYSSKSYGTGNQSAIARADKAKKIIEDNYIPCVVLLKEAANEGYEDAQRFLIEPDDVRFLEAEQIWALHIAPLIEEPKLAATPTKPKQEPDPDSKSNSFPPAPQPVATSAKSSLDSTTNLPSAEPQAAATSANSGPRQGPCSRVRCAIL